MSRLRTALVASTIVGATFAAGTLPAHAQMAVVDAPAFAQLLIEAQQGATQLVDLQTQIENLVQIGKISQASYEQLTNLYNSFSHITNATQLASLLNSSSASFPLPEMAQVENLLRGQGFTGSLAAQAQSILGKIQIFSPTGSDFAATQMNTSARATAGTMATAETIYNSSLQRQQGEAQLMAGLATSTDPKMSADINARATIENGYAQSQANQVSALQVMQKGQDDAEQQQQQQSWRQGSEGLLAASIAAGS